MNTCSRRTLTRISMLAVSVGLALGVLSGLSGDALARDNRDVLSSTDDCIYADETYEEGTVIVMDDGKEYKCHNGHWDEASVHPDGPDWNFPGTYEASQEAAPVYYTP